MFGRPARPPLARFPYRLHLLHNPNQSAHITTSKIPALSFHNDPNPFLPNSLLLITMQTAGGVGGYFYITFIFIAFQTAPRTFQCCLLPAPEGSGQRPTAAREQPPAAAPASLRPFGSFDSLAAGRFRPAPI